MASFGGDVIAIGSGFAASVAVMRGREVCRAGAGLTAEFRAA